MDKLEQIFIMQKNLIDRYRKDGIGNNTPEKRLEHLQQTAQAIIMEGAELLDWLPWKHWSVKSGNKQIEPQDFLTERHIAEIKVEVVDLIHFIVEEAINLGMTADDFYTAYMAKHAENHVRQDTGKY